MPDSIIFKDIEIDDINHLVKRRGKLIDLSKKEYEILLYFVKNKNRTVTRDNLLQLWEADNAFVNDNTLSVAIKRLREKMDLYELKTVRNLGYILDEKI